MGNENRSTPNSADNQEQIPHNNSLVIGAMSLVMLIVIVAGFTSLLNNKKISALETRANQLEASLQVLQKETATSITTDAVFEALKEEKAASIKRENALNDKVGLKIEGLDAQLQTLKEAVTVAQNPQDEQIKGLAVEVTQKESTLKADLKVLPQKQNDKLKDLEAKLQTLKAENRVSLKQQADHIKALSHQVIQQETAVAELTTKVQRENEQVKGLVPDTRTEETTSSQAPLIEQGSTQFSQLKTEIASQIEVQNEKIKGLEAQLQTLKEENTLARNQQADQFKALSHQITEQETTVGDLTTKVQAQNDQLKALVAENQTAKEETTASFQQQTALIEQWSSQFTQLKVDIATDIEAQMEKVKALEAQLETLKPKENSKAENAVIDEQQNEEQTTESSNEPA